MPHAFHKLWIHLIWGTKDRHPYLTGEIRNKVLFHIKGEAREKGIHLDTLNGTADHVHALLGLDPDQSIARIMNDLKGESSHWINEGRLVKAHFAWQDGYGVFSVSEQHVGQIVAYVQTQQEHHSSGDLVPEWETSDDWNVGPQPAEQA